MEDERGHRRRQRPQRDVQGLEHDAVLGVEALDQHYRADRYEYVLAE